MLSWLSSYLSAVFEMLQHIHRRLKIFRILSSRYRNRRRRFGLRLNLIAGIYNYELRYREKYIS